jgi:hypothetical protein
MKNVIKVAIAIIIPLLILIVNFVNPYPSEFLIFGFFIQLFIGGFCIYSTTPSQVTEKKFLKFAMEDQKERKQSLFISMAVFIFGLVLLVIGIKSGAIRFILYIALWLAAMFLAESSQAVVWQKVNADVIPEMIESIRIEEELLAQKQEEERLKAAKEAEERRKKAAEAAEARRIREAEVIKRQQNREAAVIQDIHDALSYALSDYDDPDEYDAGIQQNRGANAELDKYVNELIEMRKSCPETSFFLGKNQPGNLMEIGEEIADKFGSQGLVYVTQQIRVRLQKSHPYDGRELEQAWSDIWYRFQ